MIEQTVTMNRGNKGRILHVITRLIVGGAQENTLYTAERLNAKGYAVDVLIGPQTGPEGSLIEDARRRNISLYIENKLIREIHPIKDLIAFFRLVRTIRKGRYSIVHTHSSKAGILGRWAAWVAGCPTIVHTIHGWGFHSYQKSWLRFLYILVERLTLRITDHLIAVSRKDIEKGMAAGIGKADDYTLIRSGIDIDAFSNPFKNRDEVRRELRIPEGSVVVGTVTRLSPQKSPATFVRIAAEVMKKVSEAYFVIIGDGPLRRQIEKEAVAVGIQDRLLLTGVRRDVPDLLQAFDIFLLTSLWEGLPRVIPQAMAAGVPVIANAVDGNAEIIKNGENGILTIPGDIDQSVKHITRLIKKRDVRTQLSTNARNGLDEYSIDSMVAAIDQLYRSSELWPTSD
jgi:glycosyltransferase involved in cell wall biosynthesis